LKQDNHTPEVIKKREKNSNLKRLVYAAGESKEFKYDEKKRKNDITCGRTVFYVTVGQIKRTKITIKQDKDKVKFNAVRQKPALD
jgi:hypothetical protein